jgi:formylglycine-generating enzyme required for sulfatase activity
MPRIFINYRREDALAAAGRLHDRFIQAFGRKDLFMDVDAIPAGADFVTHLEEQVAACDVFISVIGPSWLNIKDAEGNRRLDDPGDFVAIEIAAALKRGIRVIPILLDGARMPSASELPEGLKPLSRRNAFKISNEQFGRDVTALIEKIREGANGSGRRIAIFAGAASLIAIGAGAYYFYGSSISGFFRPASGEAGNDTQAPRPRPAAVPADPALEVIPGSKQSFRDCPDCPEMVAVPGGSFTMGSPAIEEGHSPSEEPQHTVRIRAPLAVGKYAVTFSEWDACASAGGCNGYKPNDEGWGRGDRPVINVSWNDATAYTAWLTKKTGFGYRLLSEAEREYATRAGTAGPFWFGSVITPETANYNANFPYGGPRGEYRRKTVPVNAFSPNEWGLYQVHGNVWEWTEDCWHENYSGAPTDGSAWTAGDCVYRVIRGGAWSFNPRFLRAAARSDDTSANRNSVTGLRVARKIGR